MKNDAPLLTQGSANHQPKTLWLSDDEVDDLCAGLTNSAAKRRYLEGIGLTVNRKPNGRPLVVRSHVESVLSGLSQTSHAINAPKLRGNKAGVLSMFGHSSTS